MDKYTGTDNLECMEEAINYNHHLVKLIVENANSTENVLDFGAGIGTFAKILIKEGFNVSCLEPDFQQASRLSKENINVFKSLKDIQNQSVDYIYSLNVFEHIENDLEILKALKTKLKKKGVLFIYVPAFPYLFSQMDSKVGHYRRYTKKSLTLLSQKSGFKIRNINYVDFIGFFATLAYKIIGSSAGTINRKTLIFYDRFLFPISKVIDFFTHSLIGKNIYIVLELVDD